MRAFVSAICLVTAMSAVAFSQTITVAEIGEDGIVALAMPEGDILHVMNTQLEFGPMLASVSIDEGPVSYLVGEGDFFIIAYECLRIGDRYDINPNGMTHSCRPSHCGACGFRRSEEGKIIGCYCAVPAKEGESMCNHTISTPQTEFIDRLRRMQREKEK